MNRSVLVVEDEYDGQQVVSGMLAYMDIEATLVSEAEDALYRLENEVYDGILIDLGLPGMDGLMLLRAIRQTSKLDVLPCIIITAFNSGQVKKEAFEAGCDAFLAKPVNALTFEQEINRLVKKRTST